jgi:anti-sigma B factor antagonist
MPAPDFALESQPSPHPAVTLLVASGDIDMTAAREFGRRLESALRGSDGDVVLDLRAVEHLDSTALRGLLAARRLAEARDADMVLICARAPVLRVLKVTGLDELFPIFPDLDRALAGLGAAGPPER